MSIYKSKIDLLIKKTKIELGFYYWFLKRIYNQFRIYSDIFISLILFYLPFISFDSKIKYLSSKAIPFLANSPFQKIFKIDLYSYTQSYIYKLIKKDNISLEELTKASWLFASFRKNYDKGNQIFNLLEKSYPNNISNLKSRYIFLHPYTMLGDFSFLNKLLIFTRERLNRLLDRESGFYGEQDHLTAIGHMCLFAFLLKALDCGFINKDISEYSFVYDNKRIKNKLLANLLKDYANKLNIRIIEAENQTSFSNDIEIEIWPSQTDPNRGLLAREEYYNLAEMITEKNISSYLAVENKYIENAKNLLKSYSLDKSKFYIGMHYRSAFDDRTARNTSIENAKYICNLVKSHGGQAFLIGANKFLSRKLKKYALDISSICSSTYEYELLQLFIWSNSKFFVGSQSGGTLPPGLFGTLTLWLDYHPSGHFHPPNKKDIFIPRRVFCKSLKRYLSWEESTSEEHRYCQTENFLYANHFGYKLKPAHKSSIKDAFELAMNIDEKSLKNFHHLKSRIFYKN